MLLKIDFLEVSRTCCDIYISKRVSTRAVFAEFFLERQLRVCWWLCAELCAEPSEVAVRRAVCRT